MDVNDIPVGTVPSETISAVYNEYYSKIYKYIFYRVGDHNTAEDLVSDVFTKVLKNYYTYSSQKGKFSTWLFTIVNNTINNYYKKNKCYAALIGLEKLESNYPPEDLIVERESKEILLKAIMGLNERQKNIIALKFGACLTNREIAQMVNLTESNVGTILYRALKQLKDTLQGQM